MDVDPYRIELDVPPGVGGDRVAELLTGTDPAHVEAYIEVALNRSEPLRFTPSQVAASFGALKRWQRSGPGAGISGARLVAALEETPVFEEAVRSVFHDDLDVKRAGEFLAAIQSGDVALDVVSERTPLGTAGRTTGTELVTPENADASVIETVRERLQDDRVRLLCLHCREWTRRTKVKRVADQPECPECGSTRIAALHPWADEVVQAVRSEDKSDEQVEMTQRAHRSASLVQSHGKKAVIALAARGVGPTNAARIINNWREDEDDFYRDILAREREYARTRSFWD
jgi:ATP-dependent Lhr-like helicase